MTVKRYDCETYEEPYDPSTYARMEENPNGEYVRYEDYQILKDQTSDLKDHLNGIQEEPKDSWGYY